MAVNDPQSSFRAKYEQAMAEEQHPDADAFFQSRGVKTNPDTMDYARAVASGPGAAFGAVASGLGAIRGAENRAVGAVIPESYPNLRSAAQFLVTGGQEQPAKDVGRYVAGGSEDIRGDIGTIPSLKEAGAFTRGQVTLGGVGYRITHMAADIAPALLAGPEVALGAGTLQGTGSTAEGVRSKILGQNFEQLKTAPAFNDLVSQGHSQEEARQLLADKAGDYAGVASLPANAVEGLLLRGGLRGVLRPSVDGAGRIASAARLGLAGAIGGGATGGAQQLGSNIGEEAATGRRGEEFEGVGEATIAGGVLGGVLGAGLGAAHRGATDAPPPVQDEASGTSGAGGGRPPAGMLPPGGGPLEGEYIPKGEGPGEGGIQFGAGDKQELPPGGRTDSNGAVFDGATGHLLGFADPKMEAVHQLALAGDKFTDPEAVAKAAQVEGPQAEALIERYKEAIAKDPTNRNPEAGNEQAALPAPAPKGPLEAAARANEEVPAQVPSKVGEEAPTPDFVASEGKPPTEKPALSVGEEAVQAALAHVGDTKPVDGSISDKLARASFVKSEVPYGAGTSRDRGQILSSHYMPDTVQVDGKPVSVDDSDRFHETVESTLMADYGWPYKVPGKSLAEVPEQAHPVAEMLENQRLERLGVNPNKYNEAITPFLKEAYSKSDLSKMDPNLDPQPYVDSNEPHLHPALAGERVKVKEGDVLTKQGKPFVSQQAAQNVLNRTYANKKDTHEVVQVGAKSFVLRPKQAPVSKPVSPEKAINAPAAERAKAVQQANTEKALQAVQDKAPAPEEKTIAGRTDQAPTKVQKRPRAEALLNTPPLERPERVNLPPQQAVDSLSPILLKKELKRLGFDQKDYTSPDGEFAEEDARSALTEALTQQRQEAKAAGSVPRTQFAKDESNPPLANGKRPEEMTPDEVNKFYGLEPAIDEIEQNPDHVSIEDLRQQELDANQREDESIQYNKGREQALYSALTKAVEDKTKGSPVKASAEKWKQWLDGRQRSGDMRAEERNWLGLDKWLDENKGEVTREQLQTYLEQNRVHVTDQRPTGGRDEHAYDGITNDLFSGDRDVWERVLPNEQFIENKSEREDWLNSHTGHVEDAVNKDLISFGLDNVGYGRYSEYVMPGGENYREHALTLPTNPGERGPKGWGSMAGGTSHENNYSSPHWDEPNVLVHIRTNDRIMDGKKTLHLEEVQSDWHQAGRNVGYKDVTPPFKLDQSTARIEKSSISVPGKGQKEIWQVYFKDPKGGRDLSERISPGDTFINFESGEVVKTDKEAIKSAAKTIESAFWQVPDAPFKKTWPLLAIKQMIIRAADEGYERISWTPGYKHNERFAGRGDEKEEGMEQFYDKMLPAIAGDFVKKFGAKVEKGELDIKPGDRQPDSVTGVPYFDLTKSMKETAQKQGLPLFRANGEFNGVLTYSKYQSLTPVKQNMVQVHMRSSFEKLVGPGFSLHWVENPAGRLDAIGAFYPKAKVVELAMRLSSQRAMATIDHEAFHAAQNYAFTDTESETLAKAFQPGTAAYNLLHEAYKSYDPVSYEHMRGEFDNTLEAQAYAFEMFNQGKFKPQGALATLFQKLKEFIEKLGSWLKSNGFVSSMDATRIFEDFAKGKYADRNPGQKYTGDDSAVREAPKSDFTQPGQDNVDNIVSVLDPIGSNTEGALFSRGSATADLGAKIGKDPYSVIDRLGLKEIAKSNESLSYFGKWGDLQRHALGNVPIVGEISGWMNNHLGLNTVLQIEHANPHLKSLTTHREALMEHEYTKNSWRQKFDVVGQGLLRLDTKSKQDLGAAFIKETLSGKHMIPAELKALGPQGEAAYKATREVFNNFLGEMESSATSRVDRLYKGKVEQRIYNDQLTQKTDDITKFYDSGAALDRKLTAAKGAVERNPNIFDKKAAYAIHEADIRKTFAAKAEQFKALDIAKAKEKLTEQFKDAVQAKKDLKASIASEFKDLKEKPYFPLSRFGQYTIEFKDKSGEYGFTLAETTKQRKQIIDGIIKDGGSVTSQGKLQKDAFRSGATVVPASVLRTMGDSMGLDSKVQSQLQNMIHKLASPNSFLKHRLAQKGTPGFSNDFIRSFANYGNVGASFLARIKHFDDLHDSVQAIRNEQITGDRTILDEIANNFDQKLSNSLMPGEDYGVLKQIGFGIALAAVPKSAFVNLTQVPLITGPHMAARYGFTSAMTHMTSMIRDMSFEKGTGRVIVKNADPVLAKAMEQAQNYGIISQTMIQEIGSLASTGPEAWRYKKIAGIEVGRIFHAATVMFAKAEEINRVATFGALHRAEMAEHKDPEKAYAAALSGTQKLMFEYSRWNRPDALRGAGGVVFQFKNYMIHYMKLLLGSFHPGADPVDRKASVYMLGAMMLAAGVRGLPLVEEIHDVIDFVVNQFVTGPNTRFDSREAGAEMLHHILSNPLTDVVLHGLSRATPVDVSGSISMGEQIPFWQALVGASNGSISSANDFVAAMAKSLGPFAGEIGNVASIFMSTDPNGWKSWEQAMPQFLRGPSQALRYAVQGQETDRTGRVVKDDFSAPEIMAKAGGFALSDLDQKRENLRQYAADEQFYTRRKGQLMNNMDYALRTSKPVQPVFDDMRAFNLAAQNSGHGAFVIKPTDVQRSVMNRAKNRSMPVPKQEMQRYMQDHPATAP